MTGRYKAGDFVIYMCSGFTGRSDKHGTSIYEKKLQFGIIDSVNTIEDVDKKEAFYKINGNEVQEQDIKNKVVVE